MLRTLRSTSLGPSDICSLGAPFRAGRPRSDRRDSSCFGSGLPFWSLVPPFSFFPLDLGPPASLSSAAKAKLSLTRLRSSSMCFWHPSSRLRTSLRDLRKITMISFWRDKFKKIFPEQTYLELTLTWLFRSTMLATDGMAPMWGAGGMGDTSWGLGAGSFGRGGGAP